MGARPAVVGRSSIATIEVVVDRITDEAAGIRSFDLVRPDGGPLPAYEPGAHVELVLPNGLARSYSLVGPLDDVHRYRVAVGLDANSRGGSRYLHASVRVGARLRIGAPRNHFPLVEDAPATVLIAGGIGITPLWCMAQRLAALGARWELHYACRTRAAAAFLPQIAQACGSTGRLHLWCDDEHEGRPLDLAAVVAAAAPGAHLYCCGPVPMLDAYRAATRELPPERVHLEYFRPPEPPAERGLEDEGLDGFTVELARAGVSVQVPAGCSILDALMMNGIDAPYSCYEGLCGTCETRVLEGTPEHRDHILTEKARAEGSIIICCSGSRSSKLVLDL